MARTQKERSDATRARLLDAAVRCLTEHGYAATTTTRIAETAGVSRGAMLHHFPNRNVLMGAVLRHVLQLRFAEFRDAVKRVPDGPERLAPIIEATWRGISADTSFLPWLELVVASRSDPELAAVVRESAEETQRLADETVAEIFSEDERAEPLGELAPSFAFALMNGLALRKMVMGDDVAERVLDTIKRVAPLLASVRPLL
ncbi:MAG: TetR/AcrR family transcriptional regulator [Myxococcota bacterium]